MKIPMRKFVTAFFTYSLSGLSFDIVKAVPVAGAAGVFDVAIIPRKYPRTLRR